MNRKSPFWRIRDNSIKSGAAYAKWLNANIVSADRDSYLEMKTKTKQNPVVENSSGNILHITDCSLKNGEPVNFMLCVLYH